MEDEIIGLLQISSFDNWWKLQIRKKERNMVRRAEKKGVIVRPVRIDEDFIRGAHEIYNETPIRQGRRYIGYGISLADVRRKFSNLRRSEVLGAYGDKNRLMGLLWIIYGDRAARIGSFVSVTSQRDVSPNNALMAELARRCCEKGFHFIIYERMGYLPSLDSFKRHNGFKGYAIPRYYVPLSKKGALALKLGVHKGIEHALPPRLSRALLPAYSLATRVMPLRILEKIT
jgi:hypothetical protein